MPNNQSSPEVELEKRMYEAFSREGWDCMTASEWLKISKNSKFIPDIILSKDDHMYGFVECYSLGNSSILKPKKRAQILYILRTYKPEIFILTNGTSFEMYYDGKYVGNMTVPISYYGFAQTRRIRKYVQLLSGENK